MSTLYLRGKTIWIGYTDQYGIRRSVSTKIKVKNVIKRNGKPVFPQTALIFQSQLDAKIQLRLPELNTSVRSKIKLSELLNDFLETEGSQRMPSTRRLYTLSIDKLKQYFGDCPVAKIKPDDLFKWRDSLLTKDRPHSVATYIRTISPVFNYAVSKGYLNKSPIIKGLKLNPAISTPEIFTEKQLEGIKNYFLHENNTMLEIITFLEITGFRIGEALSVKWKDIDFVNGVINVHNTKENRFDSFPIDERVRTFLDSIHDRTDFVLSFHDRSHISKKLKYLVRNLRECSTCGLYAVVDGKCNENYKGCGVEYKNVKELKSMSQTLHIHSIRKTFCSRLVRAGVDIAIAHKLMRHKNINTTLKYYTAFDLSTLKKGLEQSRNLS